MDRATKEGKYISILVPENVKDDYNNAIKDLGINRHDDITKYLISFIGQYNRLQRLKRYCNVKRYNELLNKLTKGKGVD